MKPGNPSLMLEGANSFREILKDKKSSQKPLLTGEVFCFLIIRDNLNRRRKDEQQSAF
ncbi:MAG: hypothetical protein DDT21_01955 [Syntrophomonadaceae bacterium]|nr:hypothetical protein [Bacillota bacterium]